MEEYNIIQWNPREQNKTQQHDQIQSYWERKTQYGA